MDEDIKIEETDGIPFDEEETDALSGHINRLYQTAKMANLPQHATMVSSLYAYRQEYEPDKARDILSESGSGIYTTLTQTAVDTLLSYFYVSYFGTTTLPFSLCSQQIVDIPKKEKDEIKNKIMQGFMMAAQSISAETAQGGGTNPLMALMTNGMPGQNVMSLLEEEIEKAVEKRKSEMQEDADEAAGKMQTLINNQFNDGGFKAAMKSVLFFMIATKAGILKGPILRKKSRRIGYKKTKGKWKPQISTETIYCFDSVHPLNFYPAPDAIGCDDAYIFERHFLTRDELLDMANFPGFNGDRIREVLDKSQFTGQHTEPLDASKAIIEERILAYLTMGEDKVEAIEFWGKVRGEELTEWGIEDMPDEDREYEVTAWMVNKTVIMALLNPDELGHRPYHKCNLIEIPDAFWGIGMPEILDPYQTLDNAAHRAIHNNIALCGGPQIVVDKYFLSQGADSQDIHPNKVWEVNSKENYGASGNAKPVDFISLPLITGQLIQVLNFIYQKVNEIVPSYGRGDSNQGGAASTASGLSMLMNANSRMIQLFLSAVDSVIDGVVRMQYDKNMKYEDNEDIKGNFKIIVEGSKTVLYKSERINRLQQLLSSTNNPIDMNIYGIEGRKELYKELLDDFNINHETVFAAQQKPLQPQAPPQPQGAQPPQGTPQSLIQDVQSPEQALNVAGNPMQSQSLVAPGGMNGV